MDRQNAEREQQRVEREKQELERQKEEHRRRGNSNLCFLVRKIIKIVTLADTILLLPR